MTTKRKVNIALIAYTGELDGVEGSYYAQKGEEVEVSDKGLVRFDALNEEYGETGTIQEEVPAAFAAAVAGDTTRGPNPLDREVGTQVVSESEVTEEVEAEEGGDEPLPEPSRSASVQEWRDYADQEGVDDVDNKSKKQLIEELTTD